MTEALSAWDATIHVEHPDPSRVKWLSRSLAPEAAREVPRARAELLPGKDGSLDVRIVAQDSVALRAALNTYLGWIHLSLATADAANRP